MGATPSSEPSISGELWARRRRFDSTCFIDFQRTKPCWGQRWKHLPRIWLVTINDHRAMAHEYIHAEKPVLADALSEALEAAERKGWAADQRAGEAGA